MLAVHPSVYWCTVSCDHNPPTLQTDRQTDGRTSCSQHTPLKWIRYRLQSVCGSALTVVDAAVTRCAKILCGLRPYHQQHNPRLASTVLASNALYRNNRRFPCRRTLAHWGTCCRQMALLSTSGGFRNWCQRDDPSSFSPLCPFLLLLCCETPP